MLVNEKVSDKIIEELFHNYINSNPYISIAINTEADKAREKFEKYIEENVSEEFFREVESLQGSMTSAYEAQGFIHGFKYALSIMNGKKGD